MEEMYKALMRSKKRGGKMDDDEMKSKLGVLKDIHDMASNDLGHDIHGLKKVSVMSDSDEGMKEGLKKANEIVAHKQGHSMSDDDADRVSDDMHEESRRHKVAKHSEMNDEEDGMADAHGDEPEKGKKAMEGYADGGEVEHQHDQTTDFMENGPEEMSKEWGPGKNYADGGMIHPGQYGEAQANVKGTPHQNLQSEGMNTRYAAPEMKKEWDQSKNNYASGGLIHPGQFGEDQADAHGAEKQYFERHGDDSKAAMPTIKKEFGSANPHLQGNGSDEHHNKPNADEDNDDYGDLDSDEIESLIRHLMAKRKS